MATKESKRGPNQESSEPVPADPPARVAPAKAVPPPQNLTVVDDRKQRRTTVVDNGSNLTGKQLQDPKVMAARAQQGLAKVATPQPVAPKPVRVEPAPQKAVPAAKSGPEKKPVEYKIAQAKAPDAKGDPKAPAKKTGAARGPKVSVTPAPVEKVVQQTLATTEARGTTQASIQKSTIPPEMRANIDDLIRLHDSYTVFHGGSSAQTMERDSQRAQKLGPKYGPLHGARESEGQKELHGSHTVGTVAVTDEKLNPKFAARGVYDGRVTPAEAAKVPAELERLRAAGIEIPPKKQAGIMSHAERRAIAQLELHDLARYKGSTIVVVVDQHVCPACQNALHEFAKKHELSVEIHAIKPVQPDLRVKPAPGKPEKMSGGKTHRNQLTDPRAPQDQYFQHEVLKEKERKVVKAPPGPRQIVIDAPSTLEKTGTEAKGVRSLDPSEVPKDRGITQPIPEDGARATSDRRTSPQESKPSTHPPSTTPAPDVDVKVKAPTPPGRLTGPRGRLTPAPGPQVEIPKSVFREIGRELTAIEKNKSNWRIVGAIGKYFGYAVQLYGHAMQIYSVTLEPFSLAEEFQELARMDAAPRSSPGYQATMESISEDFPVIEDRLQEFGDVDERFHRLNDLRGQVMDFLLNQSKMDPQARRDLGLSLAIELDRIDVANYRDKKQLYADADFLAGLSRKFSDYAETRAAGKQLSVSAVGALTESASEALMADARITLEVTIGKTLAIDLMDRSRSYTVVAGTLGAEAREAEELRSWIQSALERSKDSATEGQR